MSISKIPQHVCSASRLCTLLLSLSANVPFDCMVVIIGVHSGGQARATRHRGQPHLCDLQEESAGAIVHFMPALSDMVEDV